MAVGSGTEYGLGTTADPDFPDVTDVLCIFSFCSTDLLAVLTVHRKLLTVNQNFLTNALCLSSHQSSVIIAPSSHCVLVYQHFETETIMSDPLPFRVYT